MAGGLFNQQDKVRPGAYVNVQSQALNAMATNETGVVAMPLELSWGPENELIEVTSNLDIFRLLGATFLDPELSPIGLALNRSNKVITYRLNKGGTKAAIDHEAMTVSAKYTGINGSEIALRIMPTTLQESSFELRVFFKEEIVEAFYFNQWAELREIASSFIDVTPKTGESIPETPQGETTLRLEGGTNGTVTATNLFHFFDLIDEVEFRTLVVAPTTAGDITYEPFYSLAESFIGRRRDEYGSKANLVVFQNDRNPDKEYVINVYNTVADRDGKVLTPLEVTAWVAGATAGAAPSAALTYDTFPAAIHALPKSDEELLTNENIIRALNQGYFVFINKRGSVVVEQDINSLVTFTEEKNQDFRKNRIMRVLDFICNDSKQSFEDNFLGQVDNDQNGRELFRVDRIRMFSSLQAEGAIQNFTTDDIEVLEGEQKDSVVLNVFVQPTDAMEKLYMSVLVS